MVETTFNPGVADFKADCASVSSLPRTESSISVVSVPFDDGAIGEGSATSLAFEARGDD